MNSLTQPLLDALSVSRLSTTVNLPGAVADLG